MKKRAKFLEMFFSLLLVTALLHSVTHLAIFDRQPETGNGGVSGFSVGDEEVGESMESSVVWSSLSRILVILEWLLTGFIILFLHFRQRAGADEEYNTAKSLAERVNSGTETDLDRLYEVLKVVKTIRLSTISRVFRVNKEVAMDWCKTLESGNFASIEYPKFGEIVLVLEESSYSGGENEKEEIEGKN